MGYLNPYQLEEIAGTLQNWHTVYNDNLQILSDRIAAPYLKRALGESVSSGHAVHLHTNNSFYKALASNPAKMPAVGLMIEAGTAPTEKRCQVAGLVTGLSGLSAGSDYYVDYSAAGVITATKPADDIIQLIGRARSTTELYLTPRVLIRGIATMHFMLKNIPASQTDAVFPFMNDTDFVDAVVPYAGHIIGIGAAANANPTNGTMTLEVAKNGAATGLTTALSNGTQRNSTTQAEAADTIAAGDYLGVIYDTDGTWAPATIDVVCTIWIALT